MNAYENAKKQIKQAVDIFDPDNKNLVEILSAPQRILEISIPVKMDNGKIKTFTGFRSQHSDARGPFKGGIRFHQDVNRDEVRALSMWMSIKTSVLDLPLGWGKWGIIVNPKELSEAELEKLARGYVQQLYKYIGPGVDVPAPDVNTNGKIMAWMMDEYSKLVGIYSPGSFTGKPLSSGGSEGRSEATAQGGVYALKAYLKRNNMDIQGKTLAIQGAGNAGLTMARLLEQDGAKLIAISDSRGGIHNTNGLDVESISELKKNRQSVSEYKDAEAVSNMDLLELDADILIPAALENQITEANADRIQAPIILELANGPITPEADAILETKNIAVIPDILANAWGVTVSYYEQVQNDANFYWSQEEVQNKLEPSMTKSANTVYEKAEELKTTLRKSAYVVALQKIKNALNDRWQL